MVLAATYQQCLYGLKRVDMSAQYHYCQRPLQLRKKQATVDQSVHRNCAAHGTNRVQKKTATESDRGKAIRAVIEYGYIAITALEEASEVVHGLGV